MFSVAVLMVFAVVGYFMRMLDFSFATFLIGFVLGDSFEVSFRQTIILYGDRPLDLFSHWIVLGFGVLTLISVWRMLRNAAR